MKELRIPLKFVGPGPSKSDSERIKCNKMRTIKFVEPLFERIVPEQYSAFEDTIDFRSAIPPMFMVLDH